MTGAFGVSAFGRPCRRLFPSALSFAPDIAAERSKTSGYSTNWFSFPRPNGTYSKRLSCTVKMSGAFSMVNCFVARVMCAFPFGAISHLYLLAPSSTSVAT